MALEILLRFKAADPAPLVERFFAGWVPAGLDQSRLEALRLWWAHGILWWAGLDLSLRADSDVDLTDVYAATRHCWLSKRRRSSGCLAGPQEPPRSIGGIVFKQGRASRLPARISAYRAGVDDAGGGRRGSRALVSAELWEVLAAGVGDSPSAAP